MAGSAYYLGNKIDQYIEFSSTVNQNNSKNLNLALEQNKKNHRELLRSLEPLINQISPKYLTFEQPSEKAIKCMNHFKWNYNNPSSIRYLREVTLEKGLRVEITASNPGGGSVIAKMICVFDKNKEIDILQSRTLDYEPLGRLGY